MPEFLRINPATGRVVSRGILGPRGIGIPDPTDADVGDVVGLVAPGQTGWVPQTGGAGVTDGAKGDVDVSGSGTVWSVPGLVTLSDSIALETAARDAADTAVVAAAAADAATKADDARAAAIQRSNHTGTQLLATISDAAAALAAKADLASPTFTGNPIVPNQSAGANNNRAANTAYVDGALATVIGTAPGVLNTLGEISDAINDDANAYTTLAALITAKVDNTGFDATSWNGVTTVAPAKDAVRDALVLLAPLASPTFTGTVVLPNDQALLGNPTAPTQTVGNNSTRIANTAFVTAAIAALNTAVAGSGISIGAPSGGTVAISIATSPTIVTPAITGLLTINAAAAARALEIYAVDTTSNNAAFFRSVSGGATVLGSVLGRYTYHGHTGSAYATNAMARMDVTCDENTATGYGTRFSFFTTPIGATNSVVEALRLTSDAAPAALFTNGSVTHPSMAFLNSTGTGLYRNSADVIGVAAAGAEVARFGATSGIPLDLIQATLGGLVQRLITTATNDDPTETFRQSRVTTADTTPAVLQSMSTVTDTVMQVEAVVVARRTGGSAGTAGDVAGYKLIGTFKNVGGTVTQIGTTTATHTAESQAGWDVTLDISSTNVRLIVTGATNNTVVWHGHMRQYSVGT